MNPEKVQQLETFTAFTARLAYDGFKSNGFKLTASQYAQILLMNKKTLLFVYGDDLICFSSSALLKKHTATIERVSNQNSFDFGEDFIVPDYFTVTDGGGETCRLDRRIATFEDWDRHNALLKQKETEIASKRIKLEQSNIHLLALVGGNKKAKIQDAILIARMRNKQN